MNGPLWDRAHSTLPSFAGMVSAQGRVFTIEDRAPISLPAMPGKYVLVARDAFNGMELWKHPLSGWENITHHMKGAPPQLNRRVVAVGDMVYATPGGEEVWQTPVETSWVARTHRTAGSNATIVMRGNIVYRAETDGLKAYALDDGRLLWGSKDRVNLGYTVYAMDGSSGKILWSYCAGGRVDTPPTYYRGLVLFGSRDGWVYCLRASDGELAWRFRAAPQWEHLACAFDRVESLWPVHGSVLVLGDVVYLSAGRSTFLDGGMVL